MQELWKDVKGYESLYQVSNYGKVKALKRSYVDKSGRNQSKRERILKQHKDSKGYLMVKLCNGNEKTHRVHHLVWDNFGDKERDGMKRMVDHIDNVKTNNRINNLQLLNNRQNVVKDLPQNGLPTGVMKVGKKFKSRIQHERKIYYLGYFDSPQDAHLAYLYKLKELENAYST